MAAQPSAAGLGTLEHELLGVGDLYQRDRAAGTSKGTAALRRSGAGCQPLFKPGGEGSTPLARLGDGGDRRGLASPHA